MSDTDSDCLFDMKIRRGHSERLDFADEDAWFQCLGSMNEYLLIVLAVPIENAMH